MRRFAFACYDFLDNLNEEGREEGFRKKYGSDLLEVLEDCAQRHLKVGEFQANGEEKIVKKLLKGRMRRLEYDMRSYLLTALHESRMRRVNLKGSEDSYGDE